MRSASFAEVAVGRHNGTLASKTNVVDTDDIGRFAFRGYRGGFYYHLGYISMLVNGTPSGTNIPGDMTFFTNSGSGSAEKMRLSKDGNVGIGTSSPQAILDVYGTGTGQSAIIVPRDTTALRPGGVNGMIRYNINTNRLEGYENGMWGNISVASAGIAASGTAGAIQYSSGAGAFASNNNLVIDGANGRIGIGTVTPATSLDVRDGPSQSKGSTAPILSIRADAGNSAQEGV